MTAIAKRSPGPGQREHRAARFIRRLPLYLLILFACLLTLFPGYWMLVSAVQPLTYSFSFPPPLFPKAFDFTPFTTMFAQFPIWLWLGNTILLATITTVICLVMTVLGAYILSAQKWRGRALFGFLLLVTQLLPEALIVIPVYATYQKFGLKESIPALSFVDAAFVIPIGTWVLKNVFDSIPREIYDAALIDGCHQLGVLRRVMLPIAGPGLVAVAVVSFFYAWNEYLFASNLIQTTSLWPAAVGMASIRSQLNVPIDLIMTTALFFSIFPVIFYSLVQRFVVAGLSAGAVKG